MAEKKEKIQTGNVKEDNVDDSTEDNDKRSKTSGRKINPEKILPVDLTGIHGKTDELADSGVDDRQANFKLVVFKRGDLIGSGTYGKVYQCLELRTGKLLAVKTVQVFMILLT